MAVHVLAVLAYKEGDRVTSAFLAGSVNTNPVIIRRLLLSLQRAKLVDTCKGAGSGSRLSRSPGRINLAEVYRAVEEAEPFRHAGAKAQYRLPGRPLYSQGVRPDFCVSAESHGTRPGENQPGGCDQCGKGLLRL